MSKTTLEPCPFCGAIATEIDSPNFGHYGVVPHKAGCFLLGLVLERFAAEFFDDWNRRAKSATTTGKTRKK